MIPSRTGTRNPLGADVIVDKWIGLERETQNTYIQRVKGIMGRSFYIVKEQESRGGMTGGESGGMAEEHDGGKTDF